MDNQRLLVWLAFGMMLWFTYMAWVEDYGTKPVPAEAAPGRRTDRRGSA